MLAIPEYTVFNSATECAEYTAEKILMAAELAIQQRHQFKLVLAGGNTPNQVYQLLAQANSDWSEWWIFWGDERCLAESNSERNSWMAQQIWLDQIPIPKSQIFPISAEKGAIIAAHDYEMIIRHYLPMDLVLLGMGEDGHTASLFPGQIHNANQWVHPVFNAPKPPAERVSLSVNALSATAEVIFLITGANKHQPFTQWQQGIDLPIVHIGGQKRMIYIDRNALMG